MNISAKFRVSSSLSLREIARTHRHTDIQTHTHLHYYYIDYYYYIREITPQDPKGFNAEIFTYIQYKHLVKIILHLRQCVWSYEEWFNVIFNRKLNCHKFLFTSIKRSYLDPYFESKNKKKTQSAHVKIWIVRMFEIKFQQIQWDT